MKIASENFVTIVLMAILTGSGLQGCDSNKTSTSAAADSATVAVPAIDVKTQYVETGGRKIAYRAMGKGSPLVLCNRFRGNLDTWDPAFLDALAKNYRVITFDYSGFGLSTGTASSDMGSFTKDVKDLATALGLNKVALGGWSFGGIVVQTIVAQDPGWISHGILIGTGPPGKNDTPIEPIFFERSGILNNTLDDEMILFFEPAWEPSRNAAIRSHDRIASRKDDHDIIVPEKLWGNYSKGFAEYVADDKGIREKILSSKVPLLVIMGDHDISFPVQNWFALMRKLQSAQLIVVPMAGHGPQHEHPELIAQYIDTFVQHVR